MIPIFYRYFGSNNQLIKIATVSHGVLTGPCWLIKDMKKFIQGHCNDLQSEDFILEKPVFTGKLQDSISNWIIGNPVNQHKLERSKFISTIDFKEDNNWCINYWTNTSCKI